MGTYKYLSREYVELLNEPEIQRNINNFIKLNKRKKCAIFRNEILKLIQATDFAYFDLDILNKMVSAWNNAQIHFLDVKYHKNIFNKSNFTIRVYTSQPGLIIGTRGELYNAFIEYWNEWLSFCNCTCTLDIIESYPLKPNYDLDSAY